MPFYEYHCKICRDNFKTYHNSEDRCEECPRCNSKEVSKTIPVLNWKVDVKNEASAGQRVEKFIEESRQVLEADKQNSRKDYTP